jgi:hypothetical protein
MTGQRIATVGHTIKVRLAPVEGQVESDRHPEITSSTQQEAEQQSKRAGVKQPDLSVVRTFEASLAQGPSYNTPSLAAELEDSGRIVGKPSLIGKVRFARHPTAIGGKRYRHLRKLEHQQDLEWCILPGTIGPRLGFP